MENMFKESWLGMYSKGSDLKMEPEKKPTAPGNRNKSSASSTASLKEDEKSMKLEMAVAEARSKASGVCQTLVKRAYGALEVTLKALRDLQEAKSAKPDAHPDNVYESLEQTVSKRQDALWVVLGRSLPVPPGSLTPVHPAATVEEARSVFDKFATDLEASGSVAPCAGFKDILTVVELKATAEAIGVDAECQEELEEHVTQFTLSAERLKILTNHVIKVAGRLGSTRIARNKKVEQEQAKEMAAKVPGLGVVTCPVTPRQCKRDGGKLWASRTGLARRGAARKAG